ncbi:Hydrogenase maturation protease [hydrothermal vent metagenome]|uniref:Hydrogenase maturation protease n=1 Tax=hydrothermal vent metagenome TaxID=652676 RepID=A0A3B1DI23_9ZZZZ
MTNENNIDTIILGIGNILLGDEGVGCHVINFIENNYSWEGINIVDGGTGGFHLLSYFRDYPKMILVDATMDGKQVGTVSVIEPKFASDFPTALSAHDIGLRDLIETAVLSGGLPKIILITISIEKIQNMVMTLSSEIEKSILNVVKKIEKILEIN